MAIWADSSIDSVECCCGALAHFSLVAWNGYGVSAGGHESLQNDPNGIVSLNSLDSSYSHTPHTWLTTPVPQGPCSILSTVLSTSEYPPDCLRSHRGLVAV